MIRIRFLKPLSIDTIETTIDDNGNINISEYSSSFDSYFTTQITEIVPSDKPSLVDFIINTEKTLKMLKNIDISSFSILKGDIPQFLYPPPDKNPKLPCGGCGKK